MKKFKIIVPVCLFLCIFISCNQTAEKVVSTHEETEDILTEKSAPQSQIHLLNVGDIFFDGELVKGIWQWEVYDRHQPETYISFSSTDTTLLDMVENMKWIHTRVYSKKENEADWKVYLSWNLEPHKDEDEEIKWVGRFKATQITFWKTRKNGCRNSWTIAPSSEPIWCKNADFVFDEKTKKIPAINNWNFDGQVIDVPWILQRANSLGEKLTKIVNPPN